jgi:hypothetical protein
MEKGLPLVISENHFETVPFFRYSFATVSPANRPRVSAIEMLTPAMGVVYT